MLFMCYNVFFIVALILHVVIIIIIIINIQLVGAMMSVPMFKVKVVDYTR